jgi:hypothetical protein
LIRSTLQKFDLEEIVSLTLNNIIVTLAVYLWSVRVQERILWDWMIDWLIDWFSYYCIADVETANAANKWWESE